MNGAATSAAVITSAYGIVGKTTQTRVHFFPCAAMTAATHTVNCTLTLFGRGIDPKSVVIEGGRIGAPDGIRLEDAFPSLRSEVSGLVGLTVQLTCTNHRLSLMPSQCVVEFVSETFSMGCQAAPFIKLVQPNDASSPESGLPARRRTQALLAVKDFAVNSSLVIVNGSEALLKPEIRRLDGSAIPVGTVPPRCVIESPLDELLFKEAAVQELSWGITRCEGLLFGESTSSPIAYYLLYRDSERRPICSQAL